jgi:hypothetical protein
VASCRELRGLSQRSRKRLNTLVRFCLSTDQRRNRDIIYIFATSREALLATISGKPYPGNNSENGAVAQIAFAGYPKYDFSSRTWGEGETGPLPGNWVRIPLDIIDDVAILDVAEDLRPSP